jgi:hypothetical protein
MDLHEPKSATTQLDLSVDLAGERPTMVAHGLRPNPLLRRVAAGIAGAFVATLCIGWLASGDDEVPRRMKPVLAPALPTAVLGIELARMELITADLERELAAMPASARRKLAKRATDATSTGPTTPTTNAVVPARTSAPRSGAATNDGLRGLPAAPELDPPSDAAEPGAPVGAPGTDASATPAERALPGVDAPDSESLFEPEPEPRADPDPAAAAKPEPEPEPPAASPPAPS